MTSILSLKREVEILHKALAVNDKTNGEIIQKLSFYSEKLIEFSRLKHSNDGLNHDKELTVLNLEIAAFNEAHPLSPDDLIQLRPYLGVIEEAANLEKI